MVVINILFAVLPWPCFDDPNHLALRNEPPVTAIVRNAPVITKDKVVTLRHRIVGHGLGPALIMAQTIECPTSELAVTISHEGPSRLLILIFEIGLLD